MKCSIMECSEFNVPTVLWHWVQNVIGSLDQCKSRIQGYRDSAKHNQKYILVEELNTTTPILNGAKLITELKLINED